MHIQAKKSIIITKQQQQSILFLFLDQHLPSNYRNGRGSNLRNLHLRVDGLDHPHRGEHNLIEFPVTDQRICFVVVVLLHVVSPYCSWSKTNRSNIIIKSMLLLSDGQIVLPLLQNSSLYIYSKQMKTKKFTKRLQNKGCSKKLNAKSQRQNVFIDFLRFKLNCFFRQSIVII